VRDDERPSAPSAPAEPRFEGDGRARPSDLSREGLAPAGDAWQQRSQHHDGPGAGPVVIGVLLIVGGAFLLAREVMPGLRIDAVWPYAVVLLGLVFMVVAVLRPQQRRGAPRR
jgi:hypothetical protein